MSKPEWVKKYKEPKTEIKFINGIYYKYRVSYKYSPEKKRTNKITGALLGKITENGFVESDKNTLREAFTKAEISIKNIGLSSLFFSLLDDEFKSFKRFFSDEMAQIIFYFAMVRWAYNSPIKRTATFYNEDFCSEYFSLKTMSEKTISTALRLAGQSRTKIIDWKKSLINSNDNEKSEYLMIDSTHITTMSDLLNMNAIGYNPQKNFDPQIRLMYIFSSELCQPIYYKAINGNITDVKSMKLCVEEMKLKNVIYIGDKGFYSKENINLMDSEDLQYIIPLYRNNSLIDIQPLLNENFKKEMNCFLYQKRIIWYFEYEKEGKKLITFLDESLKTSEEADYLERLENNIESHSNEKFLKKIGKFGTLTMIYKTNETKKPDEIYKAYKRRNQVELTFDAYKNFLNADKMYMQNSYTMQGWLLANFIAMIAYYKILKKLQDTNINKKYSPKDIIDLSKQIHKYKINNVWRTSEISKKTLDLFSKLDIDYLKLLES